ncbi:MAG: FAD-binding protein [Phycisphaeraceae bacterium]|nr:FAD-binding protein [Phycisphaeraceae bacterium]
MPTLPVLTQPPPADLAGFARTLLSSIAGEVRFDPHNRMLYATDASLYQVEPLGVIIPADTADALRALRLCVEHRVPILPRGGGTSLAGQCTNRAVVLDLSPNCRAILSPPSHTAAEATVEPGITIDDFNDATAPSGLFFAPDPATSRHASIGGCVGNNAAGARSILYGRTSENILGLDVALAHPDHAGRTLRFEQGASSADPVVKDLTRRVCEIVAQVAPLIRARFPKTVRRNAGYGLDMVLAAMESAGWKDGDPLTDAHLHKVNLAHLVCGSEGTLAVTLGARLLLRPRPAVKGLAVLGFDSLDGAIAVVTDILRTGPSAVELLDDTIIDLARENIECRRYVDLMPAPLGGTPLRAVLYVEYSGDTPRQINERFDALRGTVPAASSQFHTNSAAMNNAWKLRKAGEPLLHGVPGHRKPITFVEDNAIPVENLATFVKQLRSAVERHGTRAAFYAHASVGVLHVRPLLDIHDPDDRRRLREIAVEAADIAQSLGGVMSGEHGDGRVRSPLLERFYGPEIMHAFRRVKAVFDPLGLLNPGNIVEPRSIDTITQTLRVQPSSTPVTVPPGLSTYFDYSDQHGFDGAVEMCNGAGVCRKKQGGTMCPSYQATLDERHSTRGRGNALRLSITGQLASSPQQSPWNDPGTIETLNLCLSCKACKTECPSNVDISRLKAEYTAQRYRTQGAPLQARLFGAVRALSRSASFTPHLANAVSSLAPFRAIINRVMGLDPRRTLPPFAHPLTARWKRNASPAPAPHAPTVALFGDCFSMFNEPGIGLASKRVFEACGYRVILADAGCCGRAKISNGLLPQAIEELDKTLSRLAPLIGNPDIHAILVSEPSCLSVFKDDALQLNLRSPKALRQALAAKAYLPEDFLHTRWDAHPTRPTFSPPSSPVLLHAHCHQKALWGAQTSSAALARVFGDQLTTLDTGCCGMAGGFGYTPDRYDLSMKIGGLTLFPALDLSPGAAIAATGTSCRHQIHDGRQRTAKHPIELIAEALAGP